MSPIDLDKNLILSSIVSLTCCTNCSIPCSVSDLDNCDMIVDIWFHTLGFFTL
jgi:hypothetical protein